MATKKQKVPDIDSTGPIDTEAIKQELEKQTEFNILNKIQERRHAVREEDLENERITFKRLMLGFKNAFKGLRYAYKTQPNFKIHTYATIIVIILGFFFQISSGEWLALALVIGFVITMEVVNTAIETLVDLYTDKYLYLAGAAKDLGAAMVLVMAITSVVVGLIIFLPKILALFGIGV